MTKQHVFFFFSPFSWMLQSSQSVGFIVPSDSIFGGNICSFRTAFCKSPSQPDIALPSILGSRLAAKLNVQDVTGIQIIDKLPILA
jgi:hypothetical protein